MSAWSNHVEKWQGGCGSSLCAGATNVCLARGKMPCDVLFVGEAPGPSEDLLGRPFCGPAGHLLDKMINEAMRSVYDVDCNDVTVTLGLRIAFTNLVCCIPRGDDGDKFAEPPKEAIKTCARRLRELVRIAKPNLIVAVGKLPEQWLPKLLEGVYDGSYVNITHPAAILRADISSRGLMAQRCVVQLATAFEEMAIPF